MSLTSFYSPKSSIFLLWLHFMVQLAQEYMHSCFLHTKYFYLYLYIRCLPTFWMGQVLSGFLSVNSSIFKFSSVLHTKVQLDKLSNYIYKASCIRQASAMSDSPHFCKFQITWLAVTSLLIDEWPHVYSTHVHLDRYCSYTCFHVFSH